MSQDSPFTPGKKVPMEYFEIFDPEDRGHYFWEDQPVMSIAEAERLREKYQEQVKQQEDEQAKAK